jgi:FkbM family methyltransferase
VRRRVAAVLPMSVKKYLRRRFRGSYLFPAPPPRPPRARRKAPPNTRRVLELTLAAAPGASSAPTPVTLDCPATFYVPKVLQERGLAGYEPFALDMFLALTDVAPEGPVFDIGSNIGLYGVLASAYSHRPVHAFEPTPNLAGCIRLAAADNDLAIEVQEIALGESTGSATFYLSNVTDSSNSLNPDFRTHLGELTVPVERLDDYVARTGAHPSIIKIDTETTEPDVLAGGSAYIAQHRPYLLVEVLEGHVEERLTAVMDPFGYTAYHLDGPGPLPVADVIVGDSTGAAFMYLFSPQPLPDSVWERMNQWRTTLEGSTLTTTLRPDRAVLAAEAAAVAAAGSAASADAAAHVPGESAGPVTAR